VTADKREALRQAYEFLEGGDDVLVVFVRSRVRGAGSGIEIEAKTAYVATFRDDKVIRGEMYGDRAEARKAVGLPT
jgi:ketosteroid isomerase-like protein